MPELKAELPTGVSFDSSGNLYIPEGPENRIYRHAFSNFALALIKEAEEIENKKMWPNTKNGVIQYHLYKLQQELKAKEGK